MLLIYMRTKTEFVRFLFYSFCNVIHVCMCTYIYIINNIPNMYLYKTIQIARKGSFVLKKMFLFLFTFPVLLYLFYIPSCSLRDVNAEKKKHANL